MSGLRFKSLLLSYFNFNSELYIQLMFQCTCSLENYTVMYTQFKEKKTQTPVSKWRKAVSGQQTKLKHK